MSNHHDVDEGRDLIGGHIRHLLSVPKTIVLRVLHAYIYWCKMSLFRLFYVFLREQLEKTQRYKRW